MTTPVKSQLRPSGRGARRKGETPQHEREAREAGRDARQGRGVSELSATSAAALGGHPGRGEAPAPALGARLEAAFGADLSGLRIHRGREAHALAEAAGARAFTAGNSLVFGVGAFRPTTGPGFELIAHETAHALQQTGAPGPDGRLRLVPRAPVPQAEVQRDPKKDSDPADPPTLQDLKPGENAWPSLVHIYSTIKPFDPDDRYSTGENYKKAVKTIEKVVGGELPAFTDSPAAQKLAAWLPENMPGPFRARCLAFDALQIALQTDAAFNILVQHPTLETSFYTKAMKEKVHTSYSVDYWATQFIDKGVSKYVQRRWKELKERLLALALDPDQAMPAESPLSGEIERLDSLMFGGDTLLLNLVQAYTIIAIGRLEDDILGNIRSGLGDPNLATSLGLDPEGLPLNSDIVEFYFRATMVNRMINGEREGVLSPFFVRLRSELSESVGKATESVRMAVSYASAVVGSIRAGFLQSTFSDDFSGLPIQLTKSAPFTAYLDGFAKLTALDATDSALGLAPEEKAEAAGAEADDLNAAIAPAAFRERMLAHTEFNIRRGTLMIQSALLATPLREALKTVVPDPMTAGRITPGPRTSILVLLLWSDWFAKWIGELEAKDNPDHVALQRYHLGRALYTLGGVAGHAALKRIGGRVAQAKDAVLSYAIIPFSRFEVDPRSDYKKLPKEIPVIADTLEPKSAKAGGAREISELAVKTETLVDFYDLQYLIAVLPRISSEIARQQVIADANAKLPEGQEHELPPPDSIQVILDNVKKSTPHPKRWISPDGVLVRNPKDKADALQVQMRHPAVDAMLGIGAAAKLSSAPDPKWKDQILVRRPDDWRQVHYWVLPPLDPVRERLRKIPEVKKIVDAWLDDKKIGEPRNAVQWLLQLYDWAKKNEGIENLRRAITSHIDKELAEKRKDYRASLRKLTTLNRTIHLDYIRDRLSLTKDTTEQKSDRDIAYDPNLVRHIADAIFKFSRNVMPREDRDIQTVALMIQAAPEILRVVKVRTGYQHIENFFEPVALALAMATGSIVYGVSAEGDQKKVADDPEAKAQKPKGGIKAEFAVKMQGLGIGPQELAIGIGKLREILEELDQARRASQSRFVLDASVSEGLNSDLSSARLKPGTERAQFVLALPYRSDVFESAGEGDWEPLVVEKSPLERAAEARQEAPNEKEAARNAIWARNEIVSTDYPIFYNIQEVYTDFRYMPEYKASGAGSRPAELTDRKGRKIKDGTNLVRLSFSRIYKDENDETRFSPERTVVIQAGDHQLLELMTNVVDYQSRLVQLTELANLMEAGAELLLDLLEFIPGVGQAIMVARLGVNIAQMIAELDWDEIKEDLINSPQRTLDMIQSDVIGNLSGDAVWRFLLGEIIDPSPATTRITAALDTAIDRAKEKREAQLVKKKMQTGKKKKSDKYLKFLRAVSGIGLTFADAFLRAQQRVEVGVNSAQGNIAGSPVLYKHLSRLREYAIWADLLVGIADTARELALAGGAGEKASAKKERDDAQADFGLGSLDFNKAIGSMMAPLTEFELPAEVVPTDLLVEIVIDMTVGQVRNKKVKIVYEALRLTGGIELISREVSNRLLTGTSADPNKYWKEDILPMIEKPITDGRDDLVKAIYNTLNELVPSAGLTAPQPPSISFGTTPFSLDDLPETEPFLRPGDPVDPRMAPRPEDEGAPLPEDIRSSLQAGFGHDLGHVRLHDDREADAFVRGAGAEALTSGSHIYVRDGLDATRGEGAHIMRHEVSHVLQQTGARPLDESGSDNPESGRPGRGLRLDPHREAAAERMAVEAGGRSATDDGALAVEGAGELVLAPFGRTDVIKMLYKMTKNAKPVAFAEGLESGAALKRDGEAAKDQAIALVKDLRTKLVGSETKQSPTMNYGVNAIDQIKSHAAGYIAKDKLTDLVISRLAGAAVVELPKARQIPDKLKWELVSQSFLNIIEGYVYSKSGVRLTIDADNTHPDKIDSIAIRGLHIGAINANSVLYRDKIKPHFKVVDGLEEERMRQYLRGRFPLPHRWKKSRDLMVDDKELEGIAAAMKKVSTLDPNDLPAWVDYVKPAAASSVKTSLRVGTHGALTGSGAMPERESHHLPQYLLIEFYSGNNESKAISPYGPTGEYWTPGFKKGGAVETKRPASARAYTGFDAPGLSMDFTKLLGTKSSRGGGMPAVSLAAVTHKKGGLHLTPDRAWNTDKEVKAPVSQGFAIFRKHRENLIKAVKAQPNLKKSDPTWPGGPENPAGFKKLVDTALGGSTKQQEEIQTAGGEAMKEGYKHFITIMKPPLEAALSEHELPYYAGIATGNPGFKDVAGNSYRPDTGDSAWISKLMGALQAKNKLAYGELYNGGAWK